jgi:hypothetical protein
MLESSLFPEQESRSSPKGHSNSSNPLISLGAKWFLRVGPDSREKIWCTMLGAKGRAKPHLGAVELAELGVAEEGSMHVLIHLFQPDFFVAENLADENTALVPANVPAVVHSARLE